VGLKNEAVGFGLALIGMLPVVVATGVIEIVAPSLGEGPLFFSRAFIIVLSVFFMGVAFEKAHEAINRIRQSKGGE